MIKFIMSWVNGSIVRKLWSTYFLVIFVTITGITVAVYSVSIAILTEQAEQFNYQIMEMLSEKLDNTIMQIDNISYFIYQDDAQKLLNVPIQPMQEHVRINNQLASRFYSWIGFLRFNVTVNGVYLIKNERLMLEFPEQTANLNQLLQTGSWYADVRDASGRLVFLPLDDIEFINNGEGQIVQTFRFGAARWIFNLTQYEPQGVLLMDIEIPEIRKMLDSLYEDHRTELVVVNKRNEVIYSTSTEKAELFGSQSVYRHDQLLTATNSHTIQSINGKKWLSNTFYSEKTGWYFVTFTDYTRLTGNAERLSYLILGISLVGCSVAIVISTITARKITVPIKNLQASMMRVRDKNFSERIPVTETDEIGDLQRTFNDMIQEIEHLIVTVYQEDLKEKQATLNALQAQINPHFLYNTLDTINSMAVLSGNEDISCVTIALSNMFHYSVQQDKRLVTLIEELSNLNDYISIQRYRFGNRFRFLLDVPSELYDCEILRLTLQPLVENAIVHGLEPKVRGGTVRITALHKDNYLYISIKDDGVGIDEMQLAQIRNMLENSTTDPTDSESKIGISNVNERLRLFFGGSASLEFESVSGKGSCSRLRLPIRHRLEDSI